MKRFILESRSKGYEVDNQLYEDEDGDLVLFSEADARIKELEAENAALLTLIDGALEVIESWGETPAQIAWRKDWMDKAKALAGEGE